MQLIVDPIACDAHGLCVELLPELISLDDWGYPIVLKSDAPEEMEWLMRRAVSACPTLAIRLVD
jgi:ferredoxin